MVESIHGVLFEGWGSIARTVGVGLLAYAALVFVLRVSGKRTLSKMNAFDFVVTVALGSTLATILLSREVALATGVAALLVLVGMQYVVAWLSVRSPAVRRMTRSEPRLLVRNGEMLHAAMRAERVTKDEVLAAIRFEGFSSLSDVDAMILETDGSFSVVTSAEPGALPLQVVRGYDTRQK